MVPPAILDRELYTIGEAARLLTTPSRRVHPQTLRRWLEGYRRKNETYSPVLRTEPRGDDLVTWAEFVEAGLLAEYRKDVPLQRLRPMIEAMRDEFGIPYPLAHFRPLVDVSSRQVVLDLQEQLRLDRTLYLVVRQPDAMQGLVWTDPVAHFLKKVDFDDDGIARRVRPLGKSSVVVIDPVLAFGVPTIGGIRTEILVEHFRSGELIHRIADDFGLVSQQVEEAIRWETTAAEPSAACPIPYLVSATTWTRACSALVRHSTGSAATSPTRAPTASPSPRRTSTTISGYPLWANTSGRC